MKIKRKSDFKPPTVNDDKMRGVRFYPLITTQDGAPNFAMRVFEVEPHGYSPKHTHRWEHEIYILSGSGHVLTADGRLPVSKDCALLVEPDELHQIQAGKEGIMFLCVVPHEGQPA